MAPVAERRAIGDRDLRVQVKGVIDRGSGPRIRQATHDPRAQSFGAEPETV
jgi:hypothetical protein